MKLYFSMEYGISESFHHEIFQIVFIVQIEEPIQLSGNNKLTRFGLGIISHTTTDCRKKSRNRANYTAP